MIDDYFNKKRQFFYKGFKCICYDSNAKNKSVTPYVEVYNGDNYVGYFDTNVLQRRFVFESSSDIYRHVAYLWQSEYCGNFINSQQRYNEIVKGLQYYVKVTKFLVEPVIFSYHKFYYRYKNFQFDLTCESHPQQYDVYYKYNYIGYIRIRHGKAIFENAPDGTVCYLNEHHEYNNSFQERGHFLEYCAKAWLRYNDKKLS